MAEDKKYGEPVYLTIQASNKSAEYIGKLITQAVEEAQEYSAPLYIVVQAGNPLPPVCPPGQICS